MARKFEYRLLAGSREADLPGMDELASAGEDGWHVVSIERNTAIVQFGDPHAIRFSHVLLEREAVPDEDGKASRRGT